MAETTTPRREPGPAPPPPPPPLPGPRCDRLYPTLPPAQLARIATHGRHKVFLVRWAPTGQIRPVE